MRTLSGRKRPRVEAAASNTDVRWPRSAAGATPPSFEDADDRDKAETPLVAFQHIAPILEAIAAEAAVSTQTLHVLDPYFCAGASASHLHSLGFSAAENPAADFYASALYQHVAPDATSAPGETSSAAAASSSSSSSSSSFRMPHVVVTNPPFSGSHIPRLLAFARALGSRHGVPSLLLLPEWVTAKGYWLEHASEWRSEAEAPVLFCGPTAAPYAFAAPAAARASSSSGGDKSSEGTVAVNTGYFSCVWYVHLPGALRDRVLARLTQQQQQQAGSSAAPIIAAASSACNIPLAGGAAVLVGVQSALPDVKPVQRLTPAQRRWRKKMRRLGAGEEAAAAHAEQSAQARGRGGSGGAGGAGGGRAHSRSGHGRGHEK